MSKPIYNLPLHTIENQATTLGAYQARCCWWSTWLRSAA